ncbi:MAG: hypothetical protein ACE5KT_04305 [Methanosarcinales archaeon]
MEGISKEELIEILKDEELANELWEDWLELENDPVWVKSTKGYNCVTILGR